MAGRGVAWLGQRDVLAEERPRRSCVEPVVDVGGRQTRSPVIVVAATIASLPRKFGPPESP